MLLAGKFRDVNATHQYIAPPSLSRDRRIKMKKSSSSSLHKKSQSLFGFCYSFFRFIFCFSSRFFLFRTAFILSHFRFQITPADIIWNLLLFKLHTEIDHRWYWYNWPSSREKGLLGHSEQVGFYSDSAWTQIEHCFSYTI